MRKPWVVSLALTLAVMSAVPHAQAAIKAANIARAGDDCSKVGKTAVGRGIDGMDLECLKVTTGTFTGKLVWWYQNLKPLGRYEVVTPTDTRTSDSKEVAASRTGDRIGAVFGSAMKSEGLLSECVLKSIIGNSGILALSTFQNYKKRVDSSFIGNLGLLNAIALTKSPTSLTNSIPLARLVQEYEAIAVAVTSKYTNIAQLMEDMKVIPKNMTFVGGAVGGVDHVFLSNLATYGGADIKSLQYQSYSSSYAISTAVLTNNSYVALSSSADFMSGLASGKLRILGIASPDRLPWLKGKTLTSQGIKIVFGNWYGIFIPFDLPEADKKNIVHLVDVLHSSITWRNTLLANHWSDGYLSNSDFAALIDSQKSDIKTFADLLGM